MVAQRGGADGATRGELREAEANRAAALHTVFDAWAGGLPTSIEPQWIDIDGIAELVVEEHGQRADYLVIEQPLAPRLRHESGMPLRAALFATDRPVLVVPHGTRRANSVTASPSPGVTTSARRRRCLRHCAALPQAEQRLRAGRHARGRDSDDCRRSLREHGVAAELHALPIGRHVRRRAARQGA